MFYNQILFKAASKFSNQKSFSFHYVPFIDAIKKISATINCSSKDEEKKNTKFEFVPVIFLNWRQKLRM